VGASLLSSVRLPRPETRVVPTFPFSMHELSGCCDSHSDHLHHCLLGAALTCRIASAYFLSYQACNYIRLSRPDAGELLWIYLLQLQLTWSVAYQLLVPRPLRYVSKSPSLCTMSMHGHCILHPPNELCLLSFALYIYLCTSGSK